MSKVDFGIQVLRFVAQNAAVDAIRIRGARQHNLRNIDLDIPRGKLVVVTGLSGSGKSSLAFHTLYAEGQRRYVESLSTYARQFLDQLDKPEVDAIEGLSPAIAIEQRGAGANPRSVIATATEIHDYLRILFAAIGVPHDPETGESLERMMPADVVKSLMDRVEGTKIILLAPLDPEAAVDMPALVADLQRQGFVRMRVNGVLLEVEEVEARWSTAGETQVDKIEVVVDRLVIREGVDSRLADSVETALQICGAEAIASLQTPDSGEWKDISFLTSFRNPRTGFEVPELSPRHFSFNSPKGACRTCHGLGSEQFCDPDLVVPDRSKRLSEGAIRLSKKGGKDASWQREQVEGLVEHFGVSVDIPFHELPEEFQSALFYGTGGMNISVRVQSRGRIFSKEVAFRGICRDVERLYDETGSDALQGQMGRFMATRSCQTCHGRRLRKEFLAVKLENRGKGSGLGIDQFCALPIEEGAEWMEELKIPDDREGAVRPIAKEICRRLRFLREVGLGYLALDRGASTLSGGEFQRIRLATQLGAGLSGVLYVLDEPSIGLHPEDNTRLIGALESLRNLGNTIVVVEHDEDMIRSADHIIELGPGAGAHGGELIAQGSLEDVMAEENSPTGRWLRGTGRYAAIRNRARNSLGMERRIIVKGAREHNLRNVDVEIPLGMLVAVTGPSGSGKSTLVDKILKRSLARTLQGAKAIPGDHDQVEGVEHIGRLVVVDQAPLGRSPRSNPATYTGAFDHIRALFAQLPLSRQRGYSAGRFSFNIKGGRCEKCQGGGALRIDMHFLNDAFVSCDSCGGRRYNRETLEVTYKGRSIADVLNLTAEEAGEFFNKVPRLSPLLSALCEVGLGYLRLGQSANTLSGGEAQRIKLAAELAKTSHDGVLYLLDEPTTGLHHDDVKVLLRVLQRLRDAGHSVLVIEHNMEVIAESDWVIDLGPGGGRHGGEVVAVGSPGDLISEKDSPTGKWLAKAERDVEKSQSFS